MAVCDRRMDEDGLRSFDGRDESVVRGRDVVVYLDYREWTLE